MSCALRSQRVIGLWWFLVVGLFLPLVAISVSAAGMVTRVVPPSFGDIDLHPRGDTVIIAAQNGSAKPIVERSVVLGGGSGLLSFTSTEATRVEVVYPEEVILKSGGQSVTIRGVPSLSQVSIDLPGEGAQRDLSIGGSLSLRGDERGEYSGTMSIQINFF